MHPPEYALELRPPLADDTPQLLALAEASSLFGPGEVDELLADKLASIHANRLGSGHAIRVAVLTPGGVAGWSYLAPAGDGSSSGGAEGGRTSELLWLGVHPRLHRRGVGAALLRDAEATASAFGSNFLLVSTSSTDATAPARALYEAHGYERVGVERDFYGPVRPKYGTTRTRHHLCDSLSGA